MNAWASSEVRHVLLLLLAHNLGDTAQLAHGMCLSAVADCGGWTECSGRESESTLAADAALVSSNSSNSFCISVTWNTSGGGTNMPTMAHHQILRRKTDDIPSRTRKYLLHHVS